MEDGLITRVGKALDKPFSGSMTWLQLGAVTVFILTVTLAWRQVVLFIGEAV